MERKRHMDAYFTKKQHRLVLNGVTGFGILLFSTVSFASNFQNFIGINYTNPADLTVLVKKMEIIVGDDYVIPNIKFNGTIIVPDPAQIQNVTTHGITNNDTNFTLPYGRFAYRLSEQWIADIDIT